MPYEYLEVDLHGDSGVRDEKDGSPIGEGTGGWIAKLNRYAAAGWKVIWIDRDTTVHALAILERDKSDVKTAPERIAPGAVDRNMLHG